MFHRSSSLASVLFGCALMGCTPPAEPEADGRDVWWDVPGMDTHFHSDGVEVQPASGPTWRWELAGIHAAGSDAWLPGTPEVPASDDATQSFGRGGVIEHYVRRGRQIEQQFLIPEPLPLDGHDLVIEGMVDSDGTFVDHGDHWSWIDDRGALTLGDVTVLDATGRELRATMQVSYDSTRIVVDATDLASAVYPVVVDPVVGAEILVSAPSASGRVNDVAVAYNSNADELFVVWSREVSGRWVIEGRRVATDGTLLGSPVTISTQDAGLDARQPDVSFDWQQNRYLVVWSGERVAGEHEIYGRRIDTLGAALDAQGFRISTQGTEGDTTIDAVSPRVAFNLQSSSWVVVYEADATANGVQHIWSYQVSTIGVVGSREQLSTVGNAVDPDVTVEDGGDALIVWRGETTGPREIHGRLLDSTGVPQGAAEIELTAQDTGGANASTAEKPRVTYNPTEREFLVVFHGTDASLAGGLGSWHVYGTRVARDLSSSSTTRLSTFAGSARPDVAHNADTNTYLVTFQVGSLGQREILGTEVQADLSVIAADQALSSTGGASSGDDQQPAVAFARATASRTFLTVWEGDADPTVNENEQAFGRFYAPSNLAPVANANDPYNPASFTVDFSSAGSFDADGTIVAYDWDFGDLTPHSSDANPQHTYAPGGPYSVTLTVTDDSGAIGTDTALVTLPGLPIAQPVIPASGFEGTPVAFTGDYTGAQATHTFLWDFGDNSTPSTEQHPSHTYADGNTYTVQFTVTQQGGGSDTVSSSIVIANVGPTANASFPSGGNEGDVLAFSAAPSDPGSDIPYTYEWDFGDLSEPSQDGPTTTHVYTDNGSYEATLVVTDAELLESTLESATVVVDNVAPIADAGGPYSGGAGPITLSGSVTDPGTENFTYAWDFGDGFASNEQSPTHVYAEGVYTATFTVDDGDASHFDTATVTVGPPTSVSESVDSLIVYANTSYSAEFGGPDVIFAGAGGRLEPATIQNQFQAIVDALAQGCTLTNEVQEYAGGSFRRPDGYGFHSIGDATVSDARVLANPPRIGGIFDGTALTFGHPADASKFNNYGQLFADRSDGGFLAGRWVRTAGKKGVWMAIHGTCDDTGATARQALEPWFQGTLPTP